LRILLGGGATLTATSASNAKALEEKIVTAKDVRKAIERSESNIRELSTASPRSFREARMIIYQIILKFQEIADVL
jgi:anti-sigma-K factor RskA